MKIGVNLCINSVNIPVKATLNLPDRYKCMPFEITSPLELKCDIDLTQPIPYVDNVYLIKGDNSHYKIGFSKNPKKRLNDLQSGNPHPLELIACCPGAKPLEDRLHDMFDDVRKEAGSAQEWFVLDEEHVDTIKHIMAIKYYTYKFSEDVLLLDSLITTERQPDRIKSKIDKKVSLEKQSHRKEYHQDKDEPNLKSLEKRSNRKESTRGNKHISSHLVVQSRINRAKQLVKSIRPISYVDLKLGNLDRKTIKTYIQHLELDYNKESSSKEYLEGLALCTIHCINGEIEKSTCQQLRAALTSLQMSTKGLKDDLIERLKIYFDAAPIDIENINNYTCDDLRAYLDYYGLSKTGSKQVLIDRLFDHLH